MSAVIKSIALGVLSAVCLLSCQPSGKKAVLTIACAASVQYAMSELAQVYEDKYGTLCRVIVGSSGKLTAQINNGAPYDLFISADMKYPTALFEGGFTTGDPIKYGQGQLVLWTMKNGPAPTLDQLETSSVQKIAIANPRLAPYGVAAREALTQWGIYEKVEHKLVIGESIAQVNQFVTAGAVDVGFTSLSTVSAPGLKNEGTWLTLPSELHRPLGQGVVILKDATLPGEAKRFVDLMLSAEGQHILSSYGYLVPTARSSN